MKTNVKRGNIFIRHIFFVVNAQQARAFVLGKPSAMFGSKAEPTRVKHPSHVPLQGRLLALPAKIRTRQERLVRHKRSSLFCLVVTDEEKNRRTTLPPVRSKPPVFATVALRRIGTTRPRRRASSSRSKCYKTFYGHNFKYFRNKVECLLD
jgi:hypothetical protein